MYNFISNLYDKEKKQFNINLNDEINISFDINKSSIFDSKTEERI